MTDVTIGIDLGTTNSCVSIFRNGCFEIIENSDGKSVTPSCVGFTEGYGRVVGEKAKRATYSKPENFIFSAKRIIGRKYDEKVIQDKMKYWPFKVIDVDSKIKLSVDFKGERVEYYPEEISSMILNELKQTAENYLKTKVEDCVITIPAYFNDSQRQATMDAGRIAGLNVLKLLCEPTAAALAYNFLKKKPEQQYVLIYDFGGGTFDISILKIFSNKIEVIATGGDVDLGGEDFDNRILEYAMREFEKNHSVKINNDKRAIARLRKACEKVKIQMSAATEDIIDVPGLIGTLDLYITLTRSKFEEICEDLFNKTLHLLDDCLKNATLDKNEIDEIILVGGSTKVPKIRSTLETYFNGKRLNKSINPDEVVAHGAGICAAIFQGHKSKKIQEVTFYDVTPMTLGIEVRGGKMNVVIPKNSQVPITAERQYQTSQNNQESLKITVLEGEHSSAENNNVLGEFEITGFPKREKGKIKFDVIFAADANGLLTIDCQETVEKLGSKLKISYDKGRLTQNEIQRMRNHNKKADYESTSREDATREKNKIYTYCNDTILEITKRKGMTDVILKIKQKCEETMEWVDFNNNQTTEEYIQKYDEIKLFCDNNLRFV